MNTYPELWPGRGEGKDAGGQKATGAKAHGQATANLPGVPQNPMQNCAIGWVSALCKLYLASFKMRLYSTVYEAYDGLE